MGLKPIIEILVKAETWKDEVSEKIFEIDFNYSKNFIPKWENLGYWHPKEFIDQLAKLWAYYHDHPNPSVAIPLFKITKYFSYAELEFPKLYKSKVAIERVNELLKSNWKEIMRDMYWKEVEKVIRKVKEFQSLCKCVSSGKVYGGIDVISESPPNVDAVITLPLTGAATSLNSRFEEAYLASAFDNALIAFPLPLIIPNPLSEGFNRITSKPTYFSACFGIFYLLYLLHVFRNLQRLSCSPVLVSFSCYRGQALSRTIRSYHEVFIQSRDDRAPP